MGLTNTCQGCGNLLPESAILFYCDRCESRMEREKKERNKERDANYSKAYEALRRRGVEDPEAVMFFNSIMLTVLLLSPLYIIFSWPFGRIDWLFWIIQEFIPYEDPELLYKISLPVLLYGISLLNVWVAEKGLYGDTNPNTSMGISLSSIRGTLLEWATIGIYTIIIVVNYFFSPANEESDLDLTSQAVTDFYENRSTPKPDTDGKINNETPIINDTNNIGAEPLKDNLSENEDFSDFIYDFSNIIVQNTTKDFNLIFDDSLKVYHNSVNIKLKSIMEGVENYFLKWTVLKDSIVSVSQSSQNSYRYNYNKFYEIARKSDGKHFQYEIAGFYEINPISGRIYKLKDETTRKVNSFYDVDNKNHFLYSINDPDGYSNLRSSPYGDIIKKVYEAETFNVTDTIDKHCKVIFPDNTEGYIHLSRVIQRTNPT